MAKDRVLVNHYIHSRSFFISCGKAYSQIRLGKNLAQKPAHIQTLCCYEFFTFIAVASGTVPGNQFLSNRRARAQPLAKARAKLNQNVYYAAYCHQWVIPSRLTNKLDVCFGSQSNYMVYQRMIEK